MLSYTKEQFITEYKNLIERGFFKPIAETTSQERYYALVELLKRHLQEVQTDTELAVNKNRKKRVYYFSMEFLIGRLLENYLINAGLRDTAEEALKELDIDISEIFECEADPGLGNGGLGRLAACFMDSCAALSVPGTGMGLRFLFGLFRQKIESGYQIELPDAWLDNGYPWEEMKIAEAVEVRFGGTVDRSFENGKLSFHYRDYTSVLAIPYDVPVAGYGLESVNTLRLWSAAPAHDVVDMEAFNRGDYATAMKEKSDIEAITCMLYPNDNQDSGKILRIKQEYLMVSAGIRDILRTYKDTYGPDSLSELPQHVSIHINDTHPALCVPELVRILIDEEGMEWNEAWEVTRGVISFTNHTVMPEALEKWPEEMLKKLIPRVYMIIEEIDRQYKQFIATLPGDYFENVKRLGIIVNGKVRMANLSIIGSHSVNGVAKIHSDILTNSLFKDYYELTPEMFNNKTNGVSQRRFLLQSNPGLSSLITELLGDGWKKDFSQIERLTDYADDGEVLRKLLEVKRQNKVRLAEFIARTSHIAVDPDSVFDIQVKRIHAYKRQLLAAFKVLSLYNRIKADPSSVKRPYTFIFAGKAAPGYHFAKDVIKFICSVADTVNSDPQVNQILKVVFIENFCVTNAQLIYPAADLSEQISTAGKEASGTGNMKFMMNGAVTLGTMDGANVEIHDLVGDDNIEIFGMRAEEVEELSRSGNYSAMAEADRDPRLSLIREQLVNGFFKKSGTDFWGIYDELFNKNDEYFVLKDFDSYVRGFEHLSECYDDRSAFAKKSLVNIAKSAYFSSDRTIKEYAGDIWKL